MGAFVFRNTYVGAIRKGRDLVQDTFVSYLSRRFKGITKLFGPSGDRCFEEIVEERFNVSGSSATGVQGLFAANSQIMGAGFEVEVAITGATSFLIGDDSGGDVDRLFAAQTTYTAGFKKQAPAGALPGAAYQGATGDNVKLTWTGTGTGAGRVRVWVHRRLYSSWKSS